MFIAYKMIDRRMTMRTTFQEMVEACEYIGLDPRQAWVDGPIIGAARVAYVEAHKAHAEALETGDTDKTDIAFRGYAIARNAYLDAMYRGENDNDE